nr:unnamed protein product [Haemonchus contortus]
MGVSKYSRRWPPQAAWKEDERAADRSSPTSLHTRPVTNRLPFIQHLDNLLEARVFRDQGDVQLPSSKS